MRFSAIFCLLYINAQASRVVVVIIPLDLWTACVGGDWVPAETFLSILPRNILVT